MDINARISDWDDERQAKLLRIRDYSIVTITEQPFKQDIADDIDQLQISQDAEIGRLCDACKHILSFISNLIQEAEGEGKMGAHHIAMDYTLYDLNISADLGCQMCSLFQASSLGFIKNGRPSALELDEERAEDTWLYLTTNVSRMEESRCDLKMGFMNRRVGRDSGAELSFFARDGSIDNPDFGYQDLSSRMTLNTSDEKTFAVVSEWLQTCQETHDACREVAAPRPYTPRRLLRLGDTTVQVVDNTQNYTYACVSHRWGSQANVPHQLKQGGQYHPFSIADLPKNFRDAIEITKRLGIEYLWIDCFCIIQGALSDFSLHAPIMSRIYKNSVFTIAALFAENAHGGCFSKRNPLVHGILYTDELIVRPRIEDLLWRLEVEGDPAQASPLHTRAWVVQERLAAPRTIYYGSLGVYWECHCMRASEGYLRENEDINDSFKAILPKCLEAASEAAQNPSVASRNTFLTQWQMLVEIYSLCDLTFHGDKEAAIRGIVTEIENIGNTELLPGSLWSDYLATGLLWYHDWSIYTFVRPDLAHRVPDGGFPTWSWASMVGKIKYINVLGEVVWEPEIRQILDPADKHPNRLVLTTWKRPVRLTEWAELALEDDGSGTGDLDEEYGWYSDLKEPEDTPMEIVLVQRISTSEDSFQRQVRCLVVVPRDGDVYERVGMVFIRFTSEGDDPFPTDDPSDEGECDVVLV